MVGSGHKSMASVAPSGVLAINEEFAPKAFRTTGMVGDLTKRKFGIKEVEMLGCTLMGGTLLFYDGIVPHGKRTRAPLGRRGKKVELFH